jgi:hypothetical protein
MQILQPRSDLPARKRNKIQKKKSLQLQERRENYLVKFFVDLIIQTTIFLRAARGCLVVLVFFLAIK